MTPKEAFKFAFLLRCAEEGLTVEQAQERAARGLEKDAGEISDVMNTLAGWGGNALGWGGTALKYGIPLGVGAAALGGAGIGALGAKLQEGDVDPAEVQREELISAYHTQADLARRKTIMDAAQRLRPRPRSHVGI
jgi:hypothetical protein